MRKVEIVSAIKVTLQEEEGHERKAKISELKQKANQFGGKCLQTEEGANEAVVFFTGDNLEVLSIMLGS